MALFSRKYDKAPETIQPTHQVEQQEKFSPVADVRSYFKDKILQWKAFGANQIADSEIVQFFSKSEAETDVSENNNIINLTEERKKKAQERLEEKANLETPKQNTGDTQYIEKNPQTRKNARIFALPETHEQRLKRKEEDREELQYKSFFEQLETTILDPQTSIYDVPEVYAHYLGAPLEYFLKPMGVVLNKDFYILSILHPDETMIDMSLIQRIKYKGETPPASRWSNIKKNIPFFGKPQLDTSETVQMQNFAQKKFERIQNIASRKLTKEDNNTRNKWRIIEAMKNTLQEYQGKSVTTRVSQKLVEKHIGKLNKYEMTS